MSHIISKSAVARTALLILLPLLTANIATVCAQDAPASPTPTPKSAEVLRLEEEKTQAELRKAVAEANKAELEARFPKPSTTPLSGTTTLDGAVIESQMISYAQMSIAANQLVQRLKDSDRQIRTLVIYNDKDVNLILSYKVALNQLELIRTGYNDLLELAASGPQPGLENTRVESLRQRAVSRLAASIPILSVAQSIFGSFVDLTALLRTNVDIKGQVFDIEEAALVSEVFRAANAKDGLSASLFYPALFPPNLDFKVEDMKSPLLTKIESLNEVKAYADGLANALEDNKKHTQQTKADIAALKTDIENVTARKKNNEDKLTDLKRIYGDPDDPRARRRIPREKLELMLELERKIADLANKLNQLQQTELPKAQAELNRLNEELRWLLSKLKPTLQDPDKIDDTIARLRAKNEQFANFIEALVKADQVTGLNPLTSYIKAETMLSALKGAEGNDTDFYWLQLKVLKAGGNNRIKTNLLVDIFTGGNRVSHSGGTIVEYILFDRNGKSVVSDIITDYSGYVKANKVKQLKNPVLVKDTMEQCEGCTQPGTTKTATKRSNPKTDVANGKP